MAAAVTLLNQAYASAYSNFFVDAGAPTFGEMAADGLPTGIHAITARLDGLVQTGAEPLTQAEATIAHQAITRLSNVYKTFIQAIGPIQTDLQALKQVVIKEMIPYCRASVALNVFGIMLIALGVGAMMYNEEKGRKRLYCAIALSGIALVAFSTLIVANLFKTQAFLAVSEMQKKLQQT